MTTQEAYEQIRAYFSRFGAELAKEEDMGQCVYRTQDGRGCAVGCLIPDELYQKKFESNNYTALCENFPVMRGFFFGVEDDFLTAAQRYHDSVATDAENFVAFLDVIAHSFGLAAQGRAVDLPQSPVRAAA